MEGDRAWLESGLVATVVKATGVKMACPVGRLQRPSAFPSRIRQQMSRLGKLCILLLLHELRVCRDRKAADFQSPLGMRDQQCIRHSRPLLERQAHYGIFRQHTSGPYCSSSAQGRSGLDCNYRCSWNVSAAPPTHTCLQGNLSACGHLVGCSGLQAAVKRVGWSAV